MQGLVSVWRILTPAKRVMLVAAVGATVLVFSLLARTASTPPMTLLFAGLEMRTSGEVVTALERMDVPFEIKGDAIYVPANARDSVRMSLAGEGLPEQGQAGYELLDKLNGFSTTSDMFDATYWRAKEGELARTILSTSGVRAARVHIASQRTGAFSRNAPAPTAVVTVTTGQNTLRGPQAQAIRFLVSSAVPGLAAEQVTVIDADQGVILGPENPDAILDEQRTAGDREQKLESDIINLLEARVGAGNARVQVAMELDMEREAVSERIFNPDGRVISGKETTEVSETTTGGSSGAVTVASNLPEGDASAGGQSRTERTETRESVNYDMSEVKREREKLPGSVSRLSIAVFVNQVAEEATEEGGEPVLRTEEELNLLRQLVSNAAGFNEERGDTLTIQTLPFKPITNEGVLVEANPIGTFLEHNLMRIVQVVFLSIVTIILALFVVKPLLAAKSEAVAQLPAAAPATAPATAQGQMAIAHQPPQELAQSQPDAIATLREVAASKSDETANLIKSWLETAEDAA